MNLPRVILNWNLFPWVNCEDKEEILEDWESIECNQDVAWHYLAFTSSLYSFLSFNQIKAPLVQELRRGRWHVHRSSEMRRMMHMMRRWMVMECSLRILSWSCHHWIRLVESDRLNVSHLLRLHLTLVDNWNGLLSSIRMSLSLVLRHVNYLLRLYLAIDRWLVLIVTIGRVSLHVLVWIDRKSVV